MLHKNPSVNQKTVTLSSAGRYYIKIYSVPFYGKESRQKLATKYISVGAYGEMTTPTIQTDKEIYNVGENVKISWKATSANSDFAQYWLVIVNETTKQKVYGGDPRCCTKSVCKSKNSNFIKCREDIILKYTQCLFMVRKVVKRWQRNILRYLTKHT
ncbi:MAG: hypothetical protein ACLTJ5_00820 [Clostridium sp.]